MVRLKITITTLGVINRIGQSIYTAPPAVDFTEKIWRSIAFDVVEKIEKRCKAIVKRHDNLYDGDALISLSLKFHEAWALKEALHKFQNEAENELQALLNSKVINFLDQKTA